VPNHLRDSHYRGAGSMGATGYRYPHDDPVGVVRQQYAPDPVTGQRYYRPGSHGLEQTLSTRLERIRAILDRTQDASGREG
jgi:putative ATPase